MESIFLSARTRGFVPFLAGCAFLHAWIHATVTAPVYHISTGSFFVFSISSGALIIALALSVIFRRSLERFIYRPTLLWTIALISSIGTILMSNSLPLIPSSQALTIAATILTAFGTCGFLVIWGQAYAHLESIQACILATFGALGGSFVIYLIVNPFPQLVALALTALLPFISTSCAQSVFTESPGTQQGEEDERGRGGKAARGRGAATREQGATTREQGRKQSFKDQTHLTPPATGAATRKQGTATRKQRGEREHEQGRGGRHEPEHTASFDWMKATKPPFRLFAYIFAFSVPLNYLNLQMQSESGGMASTDWSLVYSCALLVVGVAIIIEYALRKRGVSALSLLMVLLATSSLLIRVFLGLQNQVLMYILMYSGYYLFVATFYTRLGLIAFESARRPFAVFALGNFFNVLGLLSGTLVGIITENLENPWLALVSILLTYALFFVGFIVMAKIRRKNIFVDSHPVVEKQEASTLSLADFVETLCGDAAKRKGLTAREEEVLTYLVRGRSIQSIAEAITLSQNTVKTHARHIYEKFDAHTREELIAAVERIEPPEG